MVIPMRASPKTSDKPYREAPKWAATYRGVMIQPSAGSSRFTRDQIKKAVETAIAKHAGEFAREK